MATDPAWCGLRENARCTAAATARYLEPVTGEITVFSGSAHPEFAEKMCQILGVELAPARTTRLSNDCLQVQLRANFEVRRWASPMV